MHAEIEKRFGKDVYEGRHIQAVGVADEGRRAFVGGNFKEIHYWNLETTELEYRIKVRSTEILNLSIQPGGDRVAAFGGKGQVLEVPSGKVLADLKGTKDFWHALYAPDGVLLCAHDKILKIWSPTGELLHKVKQKGKRPDALLPRPDGSLLVLFCEWMSNYSAHLLEVGSGKIDTGFSLGSGGPAYPALSPSGASLFARYNKGPARAFDVATGRQLWETEMPVMRNCSQMHFVDEERVVTREISEDGGVNRSVLRVWSIADGSFEEFDCPSELGWDWYALDSRRLLAWEREELMLVSLVE